MNIKIRKLSDGDAPELYIDIHTHRNNDDKNVISIRNYIIGIDKITGNQAFSMGIHPWYTSDIKALEEAACRNKDNPYWKAIGECGLDFMPEILQKVDKKQQEKIFLQQLKLAKKYQKPLIVHCVKCFDRLQKIKKKNKNSTNWILHGFAKNKILAQQLTDSGFYLSFGAFLFKSHSNREALKNTALNRIFLETDEQTAYNIQEIYQFAAQVKNVSLQKIQIEIYRNYKNVFSS